MLTEIKNCLQQWVPQYDKQRYLLAVSGGIDSIGLLHAFYSLGLECGVAHCHFGLRGADAEEDLKFVEKMATQNGFPFYSAFFNTKEIAGERGISIQMAARELRYNFLDKIADEQGYNYIAVGTQLNDRAETFLLNLSRGTGLAGLRGIQPLRGRIIRPMYDLSRQQIHEFVTQHKLLWREDQSNGETKYRRNKIRHEILPVLESLNPSFLAGFKQTLRNLDLAHRVVESQVQNVRKHAVGFRGQRISIPLNIVKSGEAGQLFLFDFMQRRGFSPSQTGELLGLHIKDTGRQFFSETWKLYLNRGMVEAEEKSTDELPESIRIFHDTSSLEKPLKLVFKRMESEKAQWNKAGKNEAWLDFDLLRFPLVLRPWRSGDIMRPLGMKNRKKISDILIDNKVSGLDKPGIFVLCSGSEIAWLIGYRIGEDFKVKSETRNVYYCRVEK